MRVINLYGRMLKMHGATKYVMAFASELKRQGHESNITCVEFDIPQPYWLTASIVTAQKDGRVKGRSSRLAQAADRFLQVPALARILPRDADVVVLHSEQTLPALPFVKRRCPSAAFVYYCYQPPREVYDLWDVIKGDFGPVVRAGLSLAIPVYRSIDRRLARAADSVLVFSPEYREFAREIYGELEYAIVPAGIDFRMFEGETESALEKRRRIRGGSDYMLLMTAALTRKKKVDDFVRLLAALLERGWNVSGTVIGEGPLRGELEGLAEELGVADRLVLTGFVSQEDLPEYYHAADILYFLEPNGAWTMSIIEAGAARVPVIVAPGGSMPTLVRDGETGFVLSEAGQEEELLERTVALLRDPQLRSRMGERNHGHSLQFSLESSVRKFVAVVESLNPAKR